MPFPFPLRLQTGCALLCLALIGAALSQVPEVPKDAKAQELLRLGWDAYQARNMEGAIACWERAAEIDPKDENVWGALAAAYSASGKEAQALDAAQKQIAIDPFHENVYTIIGTAYEYFGKMKDAETAFRKQLEISPLSFHANAMFGKFLMDQKRDKEAIEVLDVAHRIDPTNDYAIQLLAFVRKRTGDLKGAREVEADAEPQPKLLSTSYRDDLFAEYLDAASEADPDQALANAQLLTSHAMRQLMAMDPTTPQTADTLNTKLALAGWAATGAAYFRKDDFSSAEKYLYAAWRWTQAGSIAEKLSIVYEKLGQMTNAGKFAEYALSVTKSTQLSPAAAPLRKMREERVAALLGKTEDLSKVIFRVGAELSSIRLVNLGKVPNQKHSGEMSFVFTHVPPDSPRLEAVRSFTGDETLSGLVPAVMKSKYKIQFPDDTAARLVVRGIVYCSPEAECSLALIPMDGPPPRDMLEKMGR